MSMKKQIIFSLVALTMLFASCADEIVESKNDLDNQITIKAAVGKQTLTKAAEFSYWATGTGFTAKSYATGTNSLFEDFVLVYNGTTWGYGTPVMQPGYSLTYYAYHPTNNVSSYAVSTSGVASFSYTVPTTVADQKDLIVAKASTNSESVALAFDHILSQVNFAVQGIKNMKISVSNIIVSSVANTSTYNYSTGWATPTGTVNYGYTPITGALPTAGTDAITYLGNGGTAYGYDNSLMLMPQTFAPATGGNFTFNYAITDMAGTETLKTGSATAYFGDFNLATWSPGTRYIYLIDFSNLFQGGPIEFTVTVNPWVNAAAPNTAQTLYLATADKVAIEAAIATHNAAKVSGLTVFPISLPTAPEAAIVIETIGTNFAKGDKINIHCVDATGAGKVTTTVTGWTRTASGSVVTLTKD